MSYAVRRANADDAPLLAEHRARVWREVGGWDADLMAEQVPIWTAWMHDALRSGTYVSYIAEEDGEPLGSASLLITGVLPRPHQPTDREARVQSVYVAPDARRRGVARALMERLIEHARTEQLIRLVLHPSDEARHLYATLGFTALDEMGLRLFENA